jgi:hypothetical protein
LEKLGYFRGKPDMSNLNIFGTKAYLHTPKTNKNKIEKHVHSRNID